MDHRDTTDPTPAHTALLTPPGRALVESLTPYEPERVLAHLAAARADPQWADRPEVVAAAATQARLRTRALERFTGPPRWWTAAGLEQATRDEVADRHAARFVRAGIERVTDLGCGVGSDALAFARSGRTVVAVDRDPEALWALAATAADLGLAVSTRQADVIEVAAELRVTLPEPPVPTGCFVDPARRTGRGRALHPESWSPPWSWVCELARDLPATGAKAAPGIDHALIPPGAQVEWTSVAGTLVEAGVWWGPLRSGPARRVATVLRAGVATTIDDTELGGAVPVGPMQGWLVEPDPAVIRSGLVGVLAARLDATLIDARIAYLSLDRPPEPTPLATGYQVLDQVPFARKAMRAWLRTRGFGDVVVKKRGVAVVPEELRAALHLTGPGPTATVLLTRTDDGPVAFLVQRC